MTTTQTSGYPDYYADTQAVPLSDDELLATDGQGTVLAVNIQKPKTAYYWLIIPLLGLVVIFFVVFTQHFNNADLFLLIPILLALIALSTIAYYFVDLEEYGTPEQHQDEILYWVVVLLVKKPFLQLQTLSQDKKKLPRKDRAKPATLLLQSFFLKEAPNEIVENQKNISDRKGKYKVEQYLSFNGSTYQLRQVTTPTNRKNTVPPIS